MYVGFRSSTQPTVLQFFGSNAKGNAGKWSDIDVSLVSKDFTGVRFMIEKRDPL
ncbi:MAG: nucleotidyltransferase domain-containing protein [Candidatus Anammoxibacter sp.]